MLCQRKVTSESFDNHNKLTLNSFFVVFSVFFFHKDRRKLGKMEETSTQTQCPVSKILQRYISEIKLSMRFNSLTEYTFSTWRICFHFLGKLLLCAIVFVSQ